jgi:RNA-directed DNA polymerase
MAVKRPKSRAEGGQSARSSDDIPIKSGGSQGAQESGSEMDETHEMNIGESGGEIGKPKQAEETRTQPEWVERSVWTDRMWQRLAASQEQTVWFSLWDKVWNQDNLNQAVLEVVLNAGCAGVDGKSTRQLQEQWCVEVEALERELREGCYRPLPVKRAWIAKLGSKEKRPLGIPTVRDRVVQAALRHVLEPIFERDFAAHSYGFRPGKSAQQALARVEMKLREGFHWVVDADLKSYFDTIPHESLIEAVRRRIADGKVIDLIESYLKAGVMESTKEWRPTQRGTPQGAVISPMLANLYLNGLDHLMAQGGWEMTRYADDFIVMCRTEAQAQQALETITKWVQGAGLQLHPTKTRIVDAAVKGGFDFLGYHFERYSNSGGKKWPRKKSELKLDEAIREKTGRLRPGSIEMIIAEINPTLKGWYAYFRESSFNSLAATDSWVRQRLRSILRRRQKRRGISKGRENVEIPNQWFAERGLFSMAKAVAQRNAITS